jgi:hypothetical protein
MTSPGRRINDFVIEYGKVERKTEPDRVSRLHFCPCNVECFLICFLRVFDNCCLPKKYNKTVMVTNSKRFELGKTNNRFAERPQSEGFLMAVLSEK